MARPVTLSKARKATIRPVERLSSFLRVKPLLDFPRRPKMPWEWMRYTRVTRPTRDGWREIRERTVKTALDIRNPLIKRPHASGVEFFAADQ